MPVTINGSNTPTAGGVTYGDGTQYATTAAGTSGQVLTSAGSGAPTWSTVTSLGGGGASASGSVVLTSASAAMQLITPTAYGQSVTLPNATTLSSGIPLFNIKNVGPYDMFLINGAGTKIAVIPAYGYVSCSLSTNSTSAGVWQLNGQQYTATTDLFTAAIARTSTLTYAQNVRFLDLGSSIYFFAIVDSSNRIYGILYNGATRTAGSATLIRTLPASPANTSFSLAKISSSQILVTSCAGGNSSTAGESVVLSVSGTTITVNTAATFTLAANCAQFGDTVLVGSTYVVTMARYGSPFRQILYPITVSGTTPTVGSEAYAESSGSATNTNLPPSVLLLTSSTFMVISSQQGSSLYYSIGTVSGASITLGTSVSSTCTTTIPIFYSRLLSNGRVAAFYSDTTTLYGVIMSISGTTITKSEVTVGTITSAQPWIAANIGDYFVAAWNSTASTSANPYTGVRALIDSSGTATVGAFRSIPTTAANVAAGYYGYDASNLYMRLYNGVTYTAYAISISGGDLLFTSLGDLPFVGAISVGATSSRAYTTANERPASNLYSTTAGGTYVGGAIPFMVNSKPLAVTTNSVYVGSSPDFTSQTSTWMTLDAPTYTSTTFTRTEMV